MIIGGGGGVCWSVYSKCPYTHNIHQQRTTNVEILKESLLHMFHFYEKSGSLYVLRYKMDSVQVKYMPAVSSSTKLISEYPLSNNFSNRGGISV
jgi:hypothetical protein